MGLLKNAFGFLVVTSIVTGICAALGVFLGIFPVVLLALAMNWCMGLVSAAFASERVFDLTGASTFIACSVCSLYISTSNFQRDPQLRPLVATSLVCLWALRLGLFLFTRILKDGHDCRFDGIREQPLRFINIWSLQALWVCLTALPAFLSNTVEAQPELNTQDLAGVLVWVFGFGVEVAADWQKSAFRAVPANRGRWIDSGLWAWSRHPNYFGEILLWVGMLVLCSAGFTQLKHLCCAAISPLFVALLLCCASGVPMLEAKADAKWGANPAYQAYKKSTPTLVLRPPAAAKQKGQ
mmetsp:Transcript_17236/g.37491  ORF Transcript_17236/g.37491 Transcript_17236/m.37491 type:complete len:296 (-) Transcript_17236:377-1264(-)